MSNQWPGGFVTKNPPVPSGPYDDSTAQGLWTLSQQAGYRKQDLWPTQGNVSPDVFIENLFSTYLYPSTSSTDNQIVNGIDLAGEGGMVWIKSRTRASTNHYLVDTVRGSSLGVSNTINSNTTNAQATGANLDWVQFNSNGFTAKAVTGGGELGTNTYYGNMVGWTFRKQPKFFDIVTFVGNGSGYGRSIPHNLGSVPGCIFIKATSTTSDWGVWHRGGGVLSTVIGLDLNSTADALAIGAYSSGITSTEVLLNNVTNRAGDLYNQNGVTYVMYLFAHNAGGFGLSGNENVVSCGNLATTGTGDPNSIITLGYEPQFVMLKKTNGTGNWIMYDTMRGLPAAGATSYALYANLTNPEGGNNAVKITSTGFTTDTGNDAETYIYIAIRRGPMAVPTLGTTVFNPAFYGTNGVSGYLGYVADMNIQTHRDTSYSFNPVTRSRLVGGGNRLTISNTDAEVADAQNFWNNMTGMVPSGETATLNSAVIDWTFKRAPGFFDVVCYTGTGGASQTFTHNLGVAPELVIVKNRDAAAAWESLGTALSASQRQIYLNRTQAGVAVASGHLGWNGTDGAYKAPTSSVVYFGGDSDVGGAGVKYVAYLFATCAGVSKVGSYTGTGTTQAINCGFTAGARFVLIKRTDSTGDWYVWDSARGIVAGNDPYLLLNSTAVEVTGTDYIDTSATGFEITSTAPAAINASGGSFIFLAIS